MEPQKIRDNRITCPSCSESIPVQRQNPRGRGAACTEDWEQLPEQHMNIMQCWLSHEELSDYPHTKVSLRAALAAHGLNLTENAASGRVSELLGLGIIRVAGIERRETPTRTTTAPRYRLNIEYAARLLNSNGRLRT